MCDRESTTARALTWILVLSTLVRIVIALRFDGFTLGDDVEVLEGAFKYGTGLDHQPWDIRNLSLPLLIAPVLAGVRLLGATAPDTLIAMAILPFLLMGSLSVVLVFQLARRWSSDEWVPSLAALIYACHWLSLVYGSAPFPRVFATGAILGAALLATPRVSEYSCEPAPRIHLCLAGCMVGFAFSCRFSEALVLVPLGMLQLFGFGRGWERCRDIGMIAIGFIASICLTVGLVDWLTWGSPFASLIAFFQYTLIEQQASSIVVSQPGWWYFKRLLHWLPVSAIPLLWVAGKDRAAARCWLFVAPIVIGLSFVHHKELRYLQGVWPFVAIAAAVGVARLTRRRKALAWTLLILTLGLGASRTTMVQKRSMAAVDAARYLATSGVKTVALSQAWAYGDRLYLRSIDVLGLPLEVTSSDLREMPDSVDAVGIYEDRLLATPELGAVLAELGFTRGAEFRRSRSRPVVLFERPARDRGSAGEAREGRLPSAGRPAAVGRKNDRSLAKGRALHAPHNLRA